MGMKHVDNNNYMYSIQEHTASSHGQLIDVTPTPLLFFQTQYTHKDTQLQLAVKLIISDHQAPSREQNASIIEILTNLSIM